jgi:hypothetical protein
MQLSTHCAPLWELETALSRKEPRHQVTAYFVLAVHVFALLPVSS